MGNAASTIRVGLITTGFLAFFIGQAAHAEPSHWQYEWPKTDFSKTTVDYSEIRSGGPPKDGIPPIDDPVFEPASTIADLEPTEPVIGLTVGDETRAYPIRVLMWHEIVNDEIAGVPVSVTFCPLCNAAIVFDRRVNHGGKPLVLDFGTTGKLRKSDLVMWDKQTESWWQQFLGTAIVGDLTGVELEVLPARLESWAAFKARAGDAAKVLVPNDRSMRRYGANPYRSYDSLPMPFLYDGEVPDGIAPLARVVSLADKTEAWSLALIKREKEIHTPDGTVLTWTPGQASALDTEVIAEGKDVGNVVARKDGKDVPYFVDFAFAFHAFKPDAPIHKVE